MSYLSLLGEVPIVEALGSSGDVPFGLPPLPPRLFRAEGCEKVFVWFCLAGFARAVCVFVC